MEAKQLYRELTDGKGYLRLVYGPANADKRARILSAIRGERVPKSKAGWTVFWDAIMELYAVPPGCIAVRETALSEIVKAQ